MTFGRALKYTVASVLQFFFFLLLCHQCACHSIQLSFYLVYITVNFQKNQGRILGFGQLANNSGQLGVFSGHLHICNIVPRLNWLTHSPFGYRVGSKRIHCPSYYVRNSWTVITASHIHHLHSPTEDWHTDGEQIKSQVTLMFMAKINV